jgi:hypothetical protein
MMQADPPFGGTGRIFLTLRSSLFVRTASEDHVRFEYGYQHEHIGLGIFATVKPCLLLRYLQKLKGIIPYFESGLEAIIPYF